MPHKRAADHVRPPAYSGAVRSRTSATQRALRRKARTRSPVRSRAPAEEFACFGPAPSDSSRSADHSGTSRSGESAGADITPGQRSVKQPGRRAGSARHRTLADFVTRILALIPKNGAFVTVRLVLSALRSLHNAKEAARHTGGAGRHILARSHWLANILPLEHARAVALAFVAEMQR